MSTQQKLEHLQQLKEKARLGGGQARIDAQHQRDERRQTQDQTGEATMDRLMAGHYAGEHGTHYDFRNGGG